MKLKLSYCILVFMVLCTIQQTFAQTNKQLFAKGLAAFETKKYDEAIYNFLTILANDPSKRDIINTHWHCAIAYYSLNLYREALYYYVKTPQLIDREAALANLGGFAGQMGYDDLSVNALDSLIRKNPMSAIGYSSKGANDIAYNRLESAERNLKKAIEVDSTFSGSYQNLYIVYNLQNKEDECQKYLQKYLELEPNNPQALLLLRGGGDGKGKKSKEYEEKLEQGVRSYTQMLEANRYARVVLLRAKLYKRLGKKDLAKQDYLQALAIYNEAVNDLPDSWQMYRHRGEIYSELAEYDKALIDMEAVFRMNPLHPTMQKDIDVLKKKLSEHK